jgi:hypothetical protein
VAAALAAVAVQDAMFAHEWPHQRNLMVSVGVHSGEAGIGWLGPATIRCEELCNGPKLARSFSLLQQPRCSKKKIFVASTFAMLATR